MSKYLVTSPDAGQFLDLVQLESGLSAMLGDPQRVDAAVAPEITAARIVLRDAAAKNAALVKDPTRTEVDKHAAAKKVANAVIEKLAKAKAAIEERADSLASTALSRADSALGPKSERGVLHSEIRSWVREMAQKPDGLAAIRAAMKDNDDVAAVVWHSPRFLLGLVDSVHEEFRFEALEARKPDLYADLSNSVGLRDLAKKYDSAIRKAQTSFYNPETAEQAARRVEI